MKKMKIALGLSVVCLSAFVQAKQTVCVFDPVVKLEMHLRSPKIMLLSPKNGARTLPFAHMSMNGLQQKI